MIVKFNTTFVSQIGRSRWLPEGNHQDNLVQPGFAY